jgi:acetyl esterase/lipase
MEERPMHDAFVLPLWPETLPVSANHHVPESYERSGSPNGAPFGLVRNVHTPTITVFLPDAAIATGTAVVVCPGGGYHILAIDHEGYDVARWLTSRGIAAIVLKYRLVPTPADNAEHESIFRARLADPMVMRRIAFEQEPLMRADVLQAIRQTRQHATAWGIRTNQIGVMGFSAGGHVTISAALHYTADTRPDFVSPIYPVWFDVITPRADAPPLFMAFASDDEYGSIIFDTVARMTQAWQRTHIPVEVHAYARGGHGFGMMTRQSPSDYWIERWYEWLTTTVLC